VVIIPAIDIRGGKCVRLLRGDYGRETVFGDDPRAMAERWLGEGARALHIVDLDSARDPGSDNASAVSAIIDAVERHRRAAGGAPIVTELGGGIRDLDSVEAWLSRGLTRVVLGTAAVESPELVNEASIAFAGRIWIGIDARGGKVAVSGWTADTEVDAVDLARDVEERGAAGVIYTNIDRDGTGLGVDHESTARLAQQLRIPVIASGGVSSVDDVRSLRTHGASIAGVIVGRALYDGAVSLHELSDAASD
jgi:phosphoribosylformimino-5-aminoimidazole carboxamide ribotide isomerase